MLSTEVAYSAKKRMEDVCSYLHFQNEYDKYEETGWETREGVLNSNLVS